MREVIQLTKITYLLLIFGWVIYQRIHKEKLPIQNRCWVTFPYVFIDPVIHPKISKRQIMGEGNFVNEYISPSYPGNIDVAWVTFPYVFIEPVTHPKISKNCL